MVMNMQDKTYESRLRCLRLWTLEERRNRHDLIEVFEMYGGLVMFCCMNFLRWMQIVRVQWGTRDSTTYFFSNKVINRWNLPDKQMVDAPSINAFKSRIVYIRDNWMD